jgi:Cdc6-like AAA superfamily ATPase
MTDEEIIELVRLAFKNAGILLADCIVRRFPGETIVVVEVYESDFGSALPVANELDGKIENGFVTVKKVSSDRPASPISRATSLLDPRVNDLIELLNARSRTSEQQPSLKYVRDAAHTLNIAVSRRNHLIFGRRGVGKTALMLESKKRVEERGAVAFWINIQTMRSLSAYDAFLTTAARICDLPSLVHANRSKDALSVTKADELRGRIASQRSSSDTNKGEVDKLIPDVQAMLRLVTQEAQIDIYLFLDDFHYLAFVEQPRFLDMIHSISRDNPVWIKAAGIKHQARWFTDDPPTGLQIGHDAAIIDLDVTLVEPAKAREFLTEVLGGYTSEAGLVPNSVISADAVDRLVLASGGVPRDFLLLCATAIQVARRRANARAAGVQDVNEAAGQIAQTKLQELEDDAASSLGKAATRVGALNRLREFLLDEKQTTYFRVEFQDKERLSKEYDLLQSMMDMRLIHLINSSLSDERQAGRRSEVYMLDLSQYSAKRLKRSLRVLDFSRGHLILKDTGGASALRKGDTPNRLLGILRRAPLFALQELTPFVPSKAVVRRVLKRKLRLAQ